MRLTRPVIAFIKKNIDFLPKGRLNSRKYAWKQRKVQNDNENKLLFHWISGSCSEIACYWQWDLLSLKQCLLNKHCFCPKGSIKLHENAWKQRKVQNHNEIKLLFHWITGSCSEIACYWQWNLLRLKQCLLYKHWSSTKRSIKFTWNSWKQRKVQNHNEIKVSYYWIIASFCEIACYWQWTLLSLKQCLLNKHWFSPKGSIKFTWKCLKTM